MNAENLRQNEPKLSKETFGQMAKWMRYHYCRRRYSSSLLYGEMNTVHDLIDIFDKISRGNFDSSLEEWNRSQQHLDEMTEPKYHNTAGHPRISTSALTAESEKQNQSKQCTTEQQSWECPNMVEVDSDFDCEYYECNLYDRTMTLYYDEMK